jgi:hypothetical protein
MHGTAGQPYAALPNFKGVFGSLSVFLARLPPARLSVFIVSLFGCAYIQSQARESRRLVACTR